jgi:acyl-CoA reductase-like NAD-dependent aldehyde dehydrogenase
MQIINPSSEEIIRTVPEDNKESLQEKFQLLQRAQKIWENQSFSQRAAVIQNFSGLLLSQSERLSMVLSSEVGKPLQQSRNEISGARTRIQWLTENAERYLSAEMMSKEKELEEKITYEPLGVICNISAWNYPWLVGVNVFVTALLAGNAVMYKPSEFSTLTGFEIESLLKQAGVPNDLFQLAIGDGSVGDLLLDLPFDGYFFTGSYKTGKYIYKKCAEKMVPCQLEMGGKDPLYVAGDIIDIKQVAAGTADGAFYNNGQSCCAVERIYVQESVYANYIQEFVKEVADWKIGEPLEEGVYFGPLARKAQLAVLEDQLSDAVAKGAKILLGGSRINRKGNYFEPSILTHVTHDMKLMKEESFGPVIGIMKVKDDDEAVRLMQDTDYGLTASVYTSDKNRAEKILNRMNTGTAYWNCCDRVSAALPWSGRKNSGFGSMLSHAGFLSFVRPKAWHFRS